MPRRLRPRGQALMAAPLAGHARSLPECVRSLSVLGKAIFCACWAPHVSGEAGTSYLFQLHPTHHYVRAKKRHFSQEAVFEDDV